MSPPQPWNRAVGVRDGVCAAGTHAIQCQSCQVLSGGGGSPGGGGGQLLTPKHHSTGSPTLSWEVKYSTQGPKA